MADDKEGRGEGWQVGAHLPGADRDRGRRREVREPRAIEGDRVEMTGGKPRTTGAKASPAAARFFGRRRVTGTKHGRSGMLATMGYIIPELTGRLPGYLSPSVGRNFTDVPDGLGAISKVSAAGWARIVAYVFFCECSPDHGENMPPHGGFSSKSPLLATDDTELKTKRLNAEIANGRLCLMAVFGIFFQDGLTGSAYWGWALYTDGPPRAFVSELGVLVPVGYRDPLGLADDGDVGILNRRGVTEVKPDRISTLATMGYITPEHTGMLHGYLSPSLGLKFTDVTNGLGAFSKVPAAGWAQIVANAFFCECSEFDGRRFLSTTKEDLNFEDEDEKKELEESMAKFEPFTKLMKSALRDKTGRATKLTMTQPDNRSVDPHPLELEVPRLPPPNSSEHRGLCRRTVLCKGHDGLGHQLSALYSCMLLSRIDPAVCFVHSTTSKFQHGCVSDCQNLKNALGAPWPRLKEHQKVDRVDNCWQELTDACGEPLGMNVTCARERIRLSGEWAELVDAYERRLSYPVPRIDLAIHVRKGDRSHKSANKVVNSYAELVDYIAPRGPVHIFSEFPKDAESVVKQLHDSHNVTLWEGGSAVSAWLTMRSARLGLILHESSYSVSASLARKGRTFSAVNPPQRGSHDAHIFVCKVGSWWWSPGHGRLDCPQL